MLLVVSTLFAFSACNKDGGDTNNKTDANGKNEEKIVLGLQLKKVNGVLLIQNQLMMQQKMQELH